MIKEADPDRKWISEKLNIGEEIIYLTKEQVEKLNIKDEKVLNLTEKALLAHGEGNYEMPPKIGIHPLEDTFYHAMPAYVPAKEAAGLKWVACYPNNPQKYNLPQTTGLLVLNDKFSGCPIAIMDAIWITAKRTPAVTALSAKYLHPEAKSFGMFGCGIQGKEHVKFIVHALKRLEKIYVYDIDKKAMNELIEEIQPQIDIKIKKGNAPKELVENCEVLSSATKVTEKPQSIVKKQWISKGQTILPCDLNSFWDPEILKMADKYIVDSEEEHILFEEMGYYPDGLPGINCEIGEVILGKEKGKETKNDIIVCSNAGMAVCDVVLAREIFNRSLEKNLGKRLKL